MNIHLEEATSASNMVTTDDLDSIKHLSKSFVKKLEPDYVASLNKFKASAGIALGIKVELLMYARLCKPYRMDLFPGITIKSKIEHGSYNMQMFLKNTM